MRIDILTLFPELCDFVNDKSIIGRAQRSGRLEIHSHNIRNYTLNKQMQTDDAPYGGRQGMLLFAQPVYDCFKAVCRQAGRRPRLIYMSPCGRTLTQQRVYELSKYDNIAILCGHYEGIDERVIEEIVDEQISIGDFVVTGGELPALLLTDAIARMCDGVLAEQAGYEKESHFDGLLEYPQFTRPEAWRGRTVPEVLRGGNHRLIEGWRAEQSLERTRRLRPDLYERYVRLHPPKKMK